LNALQDGRQNVKSNRPMSKKATIATVNRGRRGAIQRKRVARWLEQKSQELDVWLTRRNLLGVFLERSRLRISNQVPIPEAIGGEYLPPSMKAIIDTRINSAPATATLEWWMMKLAIDNAVQKGRNFFGFIVFTPRPRVVKKALRQGNSRKGDFIERPSFLPAEKKPLSTDRALNSTGLWRDLVNARELKTSKVNGNFALLGF